MSRLKIITDRADNGNEFLCLKCTNAKIRSGKMSDREVFCSSGSFNDYVHPVPFVVTQCDSFSRQDPSRPTRQMLAKLQKEAYYLVDSEEGRGPTLIPPDVAKRRGHFAE